MPLGIGTASFKANLMSIRVALHHHTEYRYDRKVKMGPQVVRLRPAPHTRTPLHRFAVNIQPGEHFLNWMQDPYGNYLARVTIPEKTDHFVVDVDLVAEMSSFNPFDFFLDPDARKAPFKYPEENTRELAPFFAPAKTGPAFRRFVSGFDAKPRGTVDFLVDANRYVQEHVDYLIRMEPGVQTPDQTITKASGSCRDSSWLLINMLRHWGFAARFVSGYLIQLAPDEKSIDGPSGPAKDFTDLHAWCEVYVPGAGWIGLDPTSGLYASEGHIPLACSAEPSQAAPIEGGTDKCEVEFSHEMRVDRIYEAPRSTKPYPDATWSQIETAGRQVDRVLNVRDVRLTMGGEPTFVGIDNPDAAEWNTEALGDNKLACAQDLSLRLHDIWAPGGLRHHGQGKWYPGEPLPRWALSSYWRKDGEPLWQDQDLLADERKPTGADADAAASMLKEIGLRLGVGDQHIFEGYEDPLYMLWKEARLPTNTSLMDSKLEDPLERERLRRQLEQGPRSKVGFVLPLEHRGMGFVSGDWFLRRQMCFLTPGDSPMGYRLPLDGVPWSPPGMGWEPYTEDPFAKPSPEAPLRRMQRRGDSRKPFTLADLERMRAEQAEAHAKRARETGADRHPSMGQPATGIVRTALCIEPRNGHMRVFLPPIAQLEPFVDLIEAIELTAASHNHPVVIEGYNPPSDPRLGVFKVTPDPGVIEVNVAPAKTWDELTTRSSELYAAARASRLRSEKFDYDGRHVGSGGGCHLVVGASTPGDSPFLRNPSLLASILTFANNHPALSYLFSGQFIGPTSQSPRVDEARGDSIAELELAIKQLRQQGTFGQVPPWFVDRVLRNILVDVTGNTHRTEFSIDKLFDPVSATGRLGLLEWRAMEMPPHWQMQSAVELLFRTAIAHFSKVPYERPLVRWGNQLHDRFLLPDVLEHDLASALSELQELGTGIGDAVPSLDPDWFRPHGVFRFPVIGQMPIDGANLELRTAAEPWLTLGEETTAGGQARYVDSSLERLQVKISGYNPERHMVLVNGQRLPLHQAVRTGEAIAGVRYRAWQPPSALHPGIPVDSPLRVEVYDQWNERTIGGLSTMSLIRAGVTTTPDPSTPWRRKDVGCSGSRPWGNAQVVGTSRPQASVLRTT